MINPELKQQIAALLKQGQDTEAKSLAFQHFGNLSEATQYIDTYLTSDAPVLALIAAGEIIEAVKFVRDREGWGLRESKDYVDKLRGLV